MQNLRLILIILGALAIIALLIHGLWLGKKERSSVFRDKRTYNANDQDDVPFDEFNEGVGPVKVISSNKSESTLMQESVKIKEKEPISVEPIQRDLFFNDDEDELRAIETVKASETSTWQTNEQQEVDGVELPSANTPDDSHPAIKQPEKREDVLVLHVAAHKGATLKGDVLLQSILQTGFQFGEMRIFHRHIDSVGNGPVLFSLANMVKPGYFDPEKMADFITPGVSLFMMVPAFGDAKQNFRLMLQAAQRIADDVGGIVLDDEHHLLTPQKIDSYTTRIRDVLEHNSKIS